MLVQQNAGVDDLTIAPAIMIKNIQSVSVQVIMDTSMNLTKTSKVLLFIHRILEFPQLSQPTTRKMLQVCRHLVTDFAINQLISGSVSLVYDSLLTTSLS